MSVPEQPAAPPPAEPSNPVSPQDRVRNGLIIAAMSLLVIVLAYFILLELTEILRPLFVAVFLCYLIVPAHHWLVAHRIPSMLSYVVIVGGVLLATYVMATLVVQSVAEMSAAMPGYVYELQHSLDDLTHKLKTDWLDLNKDNAAGDTSARPIPPTTAPTASITADATRPAEATPTGRAVSVIPPPDASPNSLPDDNLLSPAVPGPEAKPSTRIRLISADQMINLARTTLQAFVGLFTWGLVVLFYLIFLLAEEAGFRQRLVNAFGSSRAEHAMAVIGKINVAVARYIAVKTFISALVGALSGIILLAFGVQYALVWALITFLFNYIPYIGSLIAVLLPIGMSFVQFDTNWQPIAIALLLTMAQQTTGSIIEPRIIGQRLGVSPLMILLSLAFWGMIWGIPGMILSAPLVVTLKIVMENIEPTRPLAKMLSNV